MKQILEYHSSNQILNFYGWWQFVVCFFAFIALMAIWWHIGKKQKDFGQVWLALSVLCWSFSGLSDILFSQQQGINLQEITEQNFVASEATNGFRSIFSLFNSLFILMALPWFKYIPKSIAAIIKSDYWKFIIGLPFLFSLLPTVSRLINDNQSIWINELDVYYSILTLLFLGTVLWESFSKRKLQYLSYLSAITILVTFVAQIYKISGSEINMTLFSAIFKTSLIMIFFALALSWVKELSETVIADAGRMKINFSKATVREPVVIFEGINGNSKKSLQFTPSLFNLFKKFAERRVEQTDWLEIKPKNDSRTGNHYDIHDYNQIKRILHTILDQSFGKNNWTKEHHEIPLKTELFEMSEKRERKIRLKIPAENIIM